MAPPERERPSVAAEAFRNPRAAVGHDSSGRERAVQCRRRRVLEVEILSRHDCIVRGPGAGELLEQIIGRSPAYIALRRGYSCQERAARDAIALAERLSYDVVVTGPRASTMGGVG
jgi:hypothetical protein